MVAGLNAIPGETSARQRHLHDSEDRYPFPGPDGCRRDWLPRIGAAKSKWREVVCCSILGREVTLLSEQVLPMCAAAA